MPDYLLVKTLHIVSAMILFGLGLGSVFYKFMTDRSGNIAAMASTNRLVVRADAWFTTPAIIVQPLSGFYLANLGGYTLDQWWLQTSILLYIVAGLCWLPVLRLQFRMRDAAQAAARHGTRLGEDYRRDARYWRLLGVPAFLAMLTIIALMVGKPT